MRITFIHLVQVFLMVCLFSYFSDCWLSYINPFAAMGHVLYHLILMYCQTISEMERKNHNNNIN